MYDTLLLNNFSVGSFYFKFWTYLQWHVRIVWIVRLQSQSVRTYYSVI